MGKNIAIGGSITDTTQAKVLYNPSTSILFIHSGAFKLARKLDKCGSALNNTFARNFDG